MSDFSRAAIGLALVLSLSSIALQLSRIAKATQFQSSVYLCIEAAKLGMDNKAFSPCKRLLK